ncbi:MAG: phosphonate ABC transporter, permease protein PhnE [Chloroflexota bacterium]|nr:phosphonate ABC transporter, permease protein PhnE [Chloroflexota bacterium]
MAKVEDTRAKVGRSATAQQTEMVQQYRAAQRQNRRWSSLGLPLVLLVLAAAHVAGWRISQIDPVGLIRDGPKMGRIIEQLIKPDIVVYDQTALINARIRVPGGGDVPDPAVTPLTKSVQVQPQRINTSGAAVAAPTSAPVAGTAVVAAIPPAGGAVASPTALVVDTQNVIDLPGAQPLTVTFRIEPGAVVAEQPVTVTGHINLPSEYPGQKSGILIWRKGPDDPSNTAFAKTIANFTTDSNGNFTTVFQAPDSSQVEEDNTLAAVATWGIGNLVPSSTLVGENGVLNKIAETVFQALMGTTFAVFISLPIAFFASRNIMGNNPLGRVVYYLARTLLNLLRSVEVLIMATIFVAAVGIGPFAGVLALVLHSIASLGKLYSEAIESIDPGPIEAVTATGAGRLQTIVFAIIPQFIPQFVSFTLYRWDVNVRMSTIIGFVGGGGIGFLLTQYIQLLDWHKAGTAIWMIALVVIAIDLASARIRQAVI